jgi:hypothetical protein
MSSGKAWGRRKMQKEIESVKRGKLEYQKPILERQPNYTLMTGKSIIFDTLGFEDNSFDAEE